MIHARNHRDRSRRRGRCRISGRRMCSGVRGACRNMSLWVGRRVRCCCILISNNFKLMGRSNSISLSRCPLTSYSVQGRVSLCVERHGFSTRQWFMLACHGQPLVHITIAYVVCSIVAAYFRATNNRLVPVIAGCAASISTTRSQRTPC